MHWKVIEIDDGPIGTLAETTELERGKIGELMVSGPMVTKEYVVRSDQNSIHKVTDGEVVWHRMGDVGYLDSQDRFWFCGRKAHRVITAGRTLYTIPCEAIFNTHPFVYRSALIGIGERESQIPVILIELLPDAQNLASGEREALIEELRVLGARNPQTRRIERIEIRDAPLPVDIRHNSKIFREQLAVEYAASHMNP